MATKPSLRVGFPEHEPAGYRLAVPGLPHRHGRKSALRRGVPDQRAHRFGGLLHNSSRLDLAPRSDRIAPRRERPVIQPLVSRPW